MILFPAIFSNIYPKCLRWRSDEIRTFGGKQLERVFFRSVGKARSISRPSARAPNHPRRVWPARIWRLANQNGVSTFRHPFPPTYPHLSTAKDPSIALAPPNSFASRATFHTQLPTNPHSKRWLRQKHGVIRSAGSAALFWGSSVGDVTFHCLDTAPWPISGLQA